MLILLDSIIKVKSCFTMDHTGASRKAPSDTPLIISQFLQTPVWRVGIFKL